MLKRVVILACFLILFLVLLWTGKAISSNEPPLPSVTVDGKTVNVYRGSYCWSGPTSGMCVDSISPPLLIEHHGKSTAKVPPGAILVIEFDDKPLAVSDHANLWQDRRLTASVALDGNKLTAPMEKGIYIYDISAWWEAGSASFVFGIEVE
jgi:hypothetical protein